MPMNCLMPHCRHRRDTYHCTLHQFPHQEPERSQWVNACRRFHKEADGTIIPWAGPGSQAAVCSCHFSSPAVSIRGRRSKNTSSRYSVPDINLPDRDYIVFKGFRAGAKRKTQADHDSENEFDEEDDILSGPSSSRATPYDDAVLTAMEIQNSDAVSTDVTSVLSQNPENNSNDAEPQPKKVRKTTKPTARKSIVTKYDPAKSGEEEPFFPYDFLADLVPWNHVYNPPDPPPELGLEIVHQVCNACAQKFVLQSSLRNHLSRIVLEITYVCRACPQILIFNNRCTFLNHCLLHEPLADREQLCRRAVVRMTKSVPSARDLDISLDPVLASGSFSAVDRRSHIGTFQSRTSPLSAFHDFSSEADTRDTMSSTGTVHSLTERGSENAPISTAIEQTNAHFSAIREQAIPGSNEFNVSEIGETLENTLDNDVKDQKLVDDPHSECPECKITFVGYHGMVAHFGSHKRPMPKFICPECFMILSSRCCYKAHVRSHTGDKPCVCPICALIIDASVFKSHLENKCLAYCRRLVTDCSICSKTMKTLQDYLQHLDTDHTEVLHKCPVCPVAFKTDDECKVHATSEHSVASLLETNKIVKCSLCLTLFPNDKKLLLQHIREAHMVTIILHGTFQFVCQICTEKPCFTLRQDLIGHYREYHKHYYRPNACNWCDFDGLTASKLSQHVQEAHENSAKLPVDSAASGETENSSSILGIDEELPPPNICPICQHECVDKEEIYTHRYSHATFDDRFWCFVCRDIFSNKHALIQHERICTRYRDENGELIAHLCETCSETFLEKDELDNHIKDEHDEVQFPCGICGLTYQTEDDLAMHTAEQHFREKRKLPFVCEVCERRKVEKAFSSATFLRRHISWAHKGKSNQIITDEAEKISDDFRSPEMIKRLKRAGESTFACAKCRFQTDERKLFKEHIETHKSNDGIQCPECGLNFIVHTSVRKHLVMVHKILDIESYLAEMNSSYGNQNSSPNEDIELSKDVLNCSVCGKRFDDAGILKVHMRSHGMAYINMKRNVPSTT